MISLNFQLPPSGKDYKEFYQSFFSVICPKKLRTFKILKLATSAFAKMLLKSTTPSPRGTGPVFLKYFSLSQHLLKIIVAVRNIL
jgi:hypothetical protein